ncbi:MAG: 5'-nucleotidase C-terminal domain-containing protein [bacterium]
MRATAGRGQTRRVTCWLVFVLLALTLACSKAQEHLPFLRGLSEIPSHHLVVLHTNDTHGHPLRFSHYPGSWVGGLPGRASLIRHIRREQNNINDHVLVLDAGDLNTGRAESNFFKAKPDLEGYNLIGYDAMALGNHEFDNPREVLKEQMKQARFPFLSANIKTKSGEYLTQAHMIRDFGGFKAAVFGLTTKETRFITNPHYTGDLVFEDEVEAAKRLVPELRKQADVVIGLVHMGIFESCRRGSKRLASEVSGIDLIVDGHTHTKLDKPVLVAGPDGHKTIIVQAWQWGLVLGRVDLWVRNRKVIDYRFETLPIRLEAGREEPDGVYRITGWNGMAEDRELQSLLGPYADNLNPILSEIIGHAEGRFLNRTGIEEETALGDIIADSMLWYAKEAGADFAIQNGGGIRADLPQGQVARSLIHEILPFDNSIIILTLQGCDMQSLFDYMATTCGRGAFPQVSVGVSFTINKIAARAENILINGKPIDPDRLYRVVTNSYLAAGGDGYKIFQKAIDRYDTSVFIKDAVIEYIEYLGGRISPTVRGRITVIKDDKSSIEDDKRPAGCGLHYG